MQNEESMNNFLYGFTDELVKVSQLERESALGPASAMGGALGSLIGLLSSAKGKRIAKTLKGGGIGALAGAGAGTVADIMPAGDITLQADKETLQNLIPGARPQYKPKDWGKVWI